MNNQFKTLFALVAVFSVFVSGCGKKTTGPATVKVSGVVKIGGAIKAGVQVTFHPTSDGGQSASGVTNDLGEFELRTGQTGTPGAMLGKYKVTLRSVGGEDDSYMNQTDDNTEAADDGGATTPDQSGGAIAAKYQSKDTTDIEKEITKAESGLEISID